MHQVVLQIRAMARQPRRAINRRAPTPRPLTRAMPRLRRQHRSTDLPILANRLPRKHLRRSSRRRKLARACPAHCRPLQPMHLYPRRAHLLNLRRPRWQMHRRHLPALRPPLYLKPKSRWPKRLHLLRRRPVRCLQFRRMPAAAWRSQCRNPALLIISASNVPAHPRSILQSRSSFHSP